MRRFIVTLVTVFSICCLVACGGEKTNDASTGSNNDEPEITAAPTVEEPTAEPTEEPTAEPTAESTANPVETLTTLRDEALAEHSRIVKEVQYRFDIASELIEVAKDYPNFNADYYYEIIPMIKVDFEQNLLTWDIDSTVDSSNALTFVISTLIEDHPELKTTEEFQKFVEAPSLDIALYNGKVTVYNYTLSNSTSSDFEELSSCSFIEDTIEY